jgi:hypothetical protein
LLLRAGCSGVTLVDGGDHGVPINRFGAPSSGGPRGMSRGISLSSKPD